MPATSVRRTMIRALRPFKDIMTEIGSTNTLYDDLKAGLDVTLTPDMLRYSADHPSYPADLDAYETWTLSGDNTLTGVA